MSEQMVHRPAAAAPTWSRPADARFLARALSLAPVEPTPPAPADAGTVREVAHPLRPFIVAAREAVFARAAQAGVDLAAVWPGVADELTERLARTAGRVLAAELETARRAGTLQGDTGPQRYRRFLAELACRDHLAELFARHPMLAHLLDRDCRTTVDELVELLDRLAADRQAIARTVVPEALGAKLIGVTLGAGDRHAGGRSVALLRFEGGAQLVYKPRSLGLHECWNELLDWFRTQRPGLAPRGVAVLAREGYGWTEFVPAKACVDVAEVELFYRRQGALLALCYALDAVDMHYENVIACGDQPVVVDVETLFHPSWRPRTDPGDDPALAALNDSVARTGLLPWLLATDGGAVDVSAFGAGDPTTVVKPDWADLGTDTMRVVQRRVRVRVAANRPVLDDEPVDPLRFGGSLHAGFVAGYLAVLAGAAALTGPGGVLERFRGRQIRVVMRATHVYASMLNAATAPSRLTDPAARAVAFAGLDDETGHEHLRALAGYERADLVEGDVPLFTGWTDARTLHTAAGKLLPFRLAASGLELAHAKIARLDMADLRRQEWLISATLATKAAPVAGATWGHAVVPQPVDEAQLLALACRIGDELIAGSVRDDRRTNWLGLEALDDRQWSVRQLGGGLADGYPGTALFLAQLGVLTSVDRYTTAAAHAARALPALVEGLARHRELAEQVGPGGFSGLGGICYALARLGRLLDDRELLDHVPAALDALAATTAEAEPGIGLGLAGGIAALRAVHAETGDEHARELAGKFRTVLARSDLAPGEGFLHGRSGVRWALGRPPKAAAAGDDFGWCTGLAGMALAAAGTPNGARTAHWFLTAAADRVPLRDQSLCHGELGVIDALIELERAGYADARRLRVLAAGRLLGAIEQHGLRCGTPGEVPTPGLLSGTAGIGYGLLRLAFPEVPSVLLLRPGSGTP